MSSQAAAKTQSLKKPQELEQIRCFSTLDYPFPSEAPLWMQDFS